jgi:aminodeoxyfutalosine synthase
METLTLDQIAAKVDAGQPLTADEAAQLGGTSDIIALGVLADRVRRQRHATRVTFVRVAELSLADAANGLATWPASAREIRIVGRPPSFEEARGAVRALAVGAGPIPLTGFSLSDLESLAAGDPAVLVRQLGFLRDEGLTLVAEARVDEVRDLAGALAAADGAGLPVACLTVGAPTPGGPIHLMRRLHDVLSTGATVTAFAPLPRQPGPEPTTGYEDVKAVALARILLPIDHIQVDWRLHGPKLAQVALTFGADDVQNVAAEDETREGWRRSAREEILRNIHAAGFEPAERDGRFVLLD